MKTETSTPAEAAPTPRTNKAIYNGHKYLIDEARHMERELIQAQDNVWLLRRASELLDDGVAGRGDGRAWDRLRKAMDASTP